MEAGKLAPPELQVNTRQRALSEAETLTSTKSNPFLTPTSPSAASTSDVSTFVGDVDVNQTRRELREDTDAEATNNPFAFVPKQLNKLLNPKSLVTFQALGGVQGIATGLQTDLQSGLSVDESAVPRHVSFDEATNQQLTPKEKETSRPAGEGKPFDDRIRIHGRNVLPAKKVTPLWRLIWNAYNDTVLIVLTVAAAISLALGLYETFGAEHPPGSPTPVDWVEGLAICIAIVIVVLVTAINDWQKEQAFARLNAKKEQREIKVTRSGRIVMISIYDVLAGDIIHLEPGDVIPVDGIFVDGSDVKCDESSATGESDAIRKTPAAAVMKALESGQSVKNLDPFIISGSKVLEGVGTFMATSVGVHSSFGQIMMSVRADIDPTPLQEKLGRLAMDIAKIGTTASGILFFVLLFRFVAGLSGDTRTPTAKGSAFMDILIVAVTIIVVAVPEGLPLAVTLALAFATTKMLKENNLVRVLRSCETMGNATAICSDKTGTLTTNKMTVVAGTFGSTSFVHADAQSDKSQPISSWASTITPAAKEILIQSIAINSTAFEGEEEGKPVFIGSKTETALLQLAQEHLGLLSLAETRANEQVAHMFPFDSGKKCMGAVIKLKSGEYRLVVKGASEILLGFASSMADFATLETRSLSDADRQSLTNTINEYANKSLRTIGLVYQDYEQWPPAHASYTEGGSVDFSSLLHDLNFLGIVGIQDPVRPGVPEAVRKAQGAGVTVRMVTGDNMQTARAIATECKIYTEGGIVMEGPEFRKLSEAEMDEVLPRLQVLARSSPEDKRILVTRLKAMGQIVAVTGDGTNDAPALKAANIGFSMGISGTEVAKEASSIILMDDNFASIITALMWGRAVNDAVQKFLQFQITVNITAVILAFVTAVYSEKMKPALGAVQLLWVNLIMDTFAALALATDPPTEKILDRPPQGKDKPLITITMWKQITGQNIYKLTVIFVLYFAGGDILGYDLSDPNMQLELDTVIFNSFVWMQIFNIFNNRRLDNKLNVLEGIFRNYFFIAIVFLIIGLQVAIIHVGGRPFQIKSGGLDGVQWAISIVTGFVCIPWAIGIRYFPDAWFAVIAGHACKPFVISYRLCCRGCSKIAGLFKKSKKNEQSDAEAGAAGVAPTIVVVDNDDARSAKGKA
ncbi:calcium-transporting ATPase [Parastagonospora nodorum]|nr:calcium-transporting ATPase [Parastagonospora nodorum]KAH4169394.1 calcium-transporting ATPase [Parastagonospora nodorum]KAH4260859.1 calcium-transporting ATPase [Parastagonospora nodorum]KAH4281470.1 calcium-transporting ATPase [Parastagonospora nodorum]KAH4611457.1 calcium-transporting ATPase [Parastagonospora nodorum]